MRRVKRVERKLQEHSESLLACGSTSKELTCRFRMMRGQGNSRAFLLNPHGRIGVGLFVERMYHHSARGRGSGCERHLLE